MNPDTEVLRSKLLAGIARSAKPRSRGLTAIIDHGPGTLGWTGANGLVDLLAAAGDFIDLAKIYALNAVLLPPEFVAASVSAYRDAGVEVYAGGILFEYAYRQNLAAELPPLLHSLGIPSLEISENYVRLRSDERRRFVDFFGSQRLSVVYEFGRKNPDEPFRAEDLAAAVGEMANAGVRHVIVEQSEIDLLHTREPGALSLIAREPWFSHVLIETDPFRFPKQHVDLVGRLGREVNLANVAPGQVLGLECIRRGVGRAVNYSCLEKPV